MTTQTEQERTPFSVLGKEVGTGTGWDEVDTMAIIIYGFQPNELGKKFLKQYSVRPDTALAIFFETGVVELSGEDMSSGPLTVDWGVFNDV